MLRKTLLTTAAMMLAAPCAFGTLVSIDIQSDVAGKFTDFSGVEANAAAADADFAVANVWNIAGLSSHFTDAAGSADTDPSWTNLVDSTGAMTGAGFSITGVVIGTDVVGVGAESGLNEDGLFFDNTTANGTPTSETISFEISGLVAGTSYKLYLNQLDVATWLGSPQNRSMSGLVDTNGDGTPNEAYQMDFPGVLITGTVAADGIIRATAERTANDDSVPTEPDWAGLQISGTFVPEPGSLALLSLGGLFVLRRRRI